MHFRPRYSLLALMLFTAAVAGGVKLWRGPHYVLDRSNPQMEDEYTYYRNWDGTKVMEGVRILRYLDHSKKLNWVTIHVYRRGEMLNISNTIKASVFTPVTGLEYLARPTSEKSDLDRLINATEKENESLKRQGHETLIMQSHDFEKLRGELK